MKGRVLVIGAGPAGMSAAIEAGKRGCKVTVVDEAPRPGGQIYRQSAKGLASIKIGLASEQSRKHALIDAFESMGSRIDYRPQTTAYAVFKGPVVHVSHVSNSETIRPDAVVITTGVGERAVPFPGWTLPGVVYAGGVQALMKSTAVRAGDRVVVAGTGPLPVAVAAQLVEAGAEVRALALLHPLSVMAKKPWGLWAGRQVVKEGMSYLRTLKQAGVARLQGWIPLRARGGTSLEQVTIARHDGTGRAVPGSERAISCDILAINFGFTCNSELPHMAGVTSTYAPERGGWVPQTDRYGATRVAGIFVAGDGAGLRGAWVAAAEGTVTGAAAANHANRHRSTRTLEKELHGAFVEIARHSRFQEAVRESLRLPAGVWSWADDETLVCRCEGVTRGRLRQAFEDGHHSLDAAKRNTRAGMGWCGGRTCLQAVAAFATNGVPGLEIPPMRTRPVARPVPLGQIGHSTRREVS